MRPSLRCLLVLVTASCDRPPISSEDLAAAAGGDESAAGDGLSDGDGLSGGCGDQARPTAQTFETHDDVETILSSMTLAEKVDQMAGFEPGAELFATPDNDRLRIRGFKFRDGPRGVRLEDGTATCFPVAMARGASFDRDLERRVGAAMAREVRALGHNLLLAPTVNTLRHPAWGRAQETYGEDPFHLGIMGAVFTQGVQGEGVPACVKHLAGNNLEDTRMTNNAIIHPQNLRENYLRQFRIVIEESDPACVMSAYNKVNGQYCSENQLLLRTILKDEWGFDGFVVSDWFAAHSTVESVLAGLDVEMPWRDNYARLKSAVTSGQVGEDVIDDAVRRILRVKFKFDMALLDEKPTLNPDVVESPEHLDLAKESAVKGAVLLKNEGRLLPLNRASVGKIAVVGVWSDKARLGDIGSSNVTPSYAVAPFEGIKAVAGEGVEVVQSRDASAAQGADVVVVIGALTSRDEGEAIFQGGDREVLTLSEGQEDLILEVAEMVDDVVVILEAGGPITMSRWGHKADAIVMAWYPGQEGGTALGQLLFGDDDFTGRLPLTWPKAAEDEPEFGNKQAETEYAYLHGYRHFLANDIEPLFPFGFGLSYTTFEYRDLALSCEQVTEGARLTADVTIANTGQRAGAEIVQLYATFPETGVTRVPLQLAGFEKVELAPGEEATVTIAVWVRDLAYFDEAYGDWVVAPGQHRLHAGPNALDLPLSAEFVVADSGTAATGGRPGPRDDEAPGGTPNVTFKVNMGAIEPGGSVDLQGSFNDWCGLCQPMADPDGDGIWALTVPLEAGEYRYTFTTNGWAGLVEQVPELCADEQGRRVIQVGSDDVDLPVHFFGRCAGDQASPLQAHGVTLTVDMTGVPGDGGVFVKAGWNGWCGGCQPLVDTGDGLFVGEFGVPAGVHRYALTTFAGLGLTEPVPSACDPFPGDALAERTVTVEESDVVVPAHLWGRCAGDDAPRAPSVQVDFRLDPGDLEGDVYLQADFNGWCSDCAPLVDEDGWHALESLPPGRYQYRFAVGGEVEHLAAGCDLDPSDGRHARFVEVLGRAEGEGEGEGDDPPARTPVHVFGECSR